MLLSVLLLLLEVICLAQKPPPEKQVPPPEKQVPPPNKPVIKPDKMPKLEKQGPPPVTSKLKVATLDPLERYRGAQPTYFYIQSLDSKLVLDLDDKNPCANAQIILCPKVEGKQSQIWSYQGSILLKNNHSGYFMDVKGGKIPGSRVITWPEYNSLNQHWVFQEQTGTFVNGMNLVLDVENAKRMPGSPLIAFPYHGGLNQKFKRIPAATNYTPLTNEFKP